MPQTKPRAFAQTFCFENYKNTRSSYHVLAPISFSLTKEQVIHFQNNSQGVVRFQKQIILSSHRNNFHFQNVR